MFTVNREFNEIYEKYKNLVLKAAYIYSGDNYDAAEDITQDTFLKLYIGFDKLKNGNIPAWLYTTAKHAAINYKKKYSRELPADDEDENLQNMQPLAESAENEYMENSLARERIQLHEQILTGLRAKNERWYDSILLVYYMQIPQAEAAEMLGIKLNVLHSTLHRAKKWIEKKYGAVYEEMNEKE